MIQAFLELPGTKEYDVSRLFGKDLLRPTTSGFVGRRRKIVQGCTQRRKIHFGKDQDQKMVGHPGNVQITPTDRSQVPQTESDSSIHRLSMGCRYRGDKIIRKRQQRRVRILFTGHRRLFPCRAHVSAPLDERTRNHVRSADFLPHRTETQEVENR